MKKFLVIFSLVFILVGCQWQQPERTCVLVRRAADTGLVIAIERQGLSEKAKEYAPSIIDTIENQILPVLEGHEIQPVSQNQLDKMLEILQKEWKSELSRGEIVAIQKAVGMALAMAPRVEDGVLSNKYVQVLKCAFQGIVDALEVYRGVDGSKEDGTRLGVE